jgi:SAM-dependent methyltransferase
MRRTVRADAHISFSDASRVRTPIVHTSTACRMCGAQDLRYLTATGHRRLIECRECAFVSAVPPIASSRADSHAQPDVTLLAPVWQFLPEEQTLQVLDFGPSASEIAGKLRALGHRVVESDTELQALVSSMDCVRHERMLDRRSKSLKARQFDLIYSYHVFEHLADPRQHLEQLLALARPGAPLLIETEMHASDHSPRLLRASGDTPHEPCAFFGHRTFARVLADTPHRIAWADRQRIVIRAWMGEAFPHPPASAQVETRPSTTWDQGC